MAAIQLVKALGGTVMTTVSTPEKVGFVRGLGADIVINRTTDDLCAAMKQHPVDIALDCIPGPKLGACLEKMANGGRWVVIATLGGEKTELDANLFFRKSFRLIGSTLRSRTPQMKAEILAGVQRTLWGAFSAGTR